MAYQDEDDVLIKKPSHPIITTLLFVSIAALMTGIWVTAKQLGQYVNPETRDILSQFTVSAVQYADKEQPEPRLEGQPGDDLSAERDGRE